MLGVMKVVGEVTKLSLEFIIHACQDVLNIRFDAGVTRASTGDIFRTEAHEIVFGEYRPVRREHPFGTSAGRPATPVAGDLAKFRTGRIEKGCLQFRPRAATLHIEQEVRCREIAHTTRHGTKPARVGVDAAEISRPAAAQACPVEHSANAKHPGVCLVIAAELVATSKAAIATRAGCTSMI